MFGYFYHQIFRKIVIGFGTLFNEIYIKKTDQNGNTISSTKVPIAYGPVQKFLARIEQSPKDLNNPVQITLPRLSFEFNGLSYDSERKLPATNSFVSTLIKDDQKLQATFMPIPYVMNFSLHIMGQQNEDMLQIMEQILPYFHPAYTITIDLLQEIGEKKDIPVILESVNMQDDYEGNYDSRRALVYTVNFKAKMFLFGPSKDVSDGIIKEVSIGYVAGSTSDDPEKAVRDGNYVVTPVATKSYSNDFVTYAERDIGYADTTLYVNSINNIPLNSMITIDDETMKVIKSDSTKKTIVVERSKFNTKNSLHVRGTGIKVITTNYNNLIKPGDDFGFDSDFR